MLIPSVLMLKQTLQSQNEHISNIIMSTASARYIASKQ
jgi:hypothetical protein